MRRTPRSFLDPKVEADWTRARCRPQDPEMFFPHDPEGTGLYQAALAAQVCARCPIRVQCVEWAMATGQEHGIWGGTTPNQRAAIRRARARQRARQAAAEVSA